MIQSVKDVINFYKMLIAFIAITLESIMEGLNQK